MRATWPNLAALAYVGLLPTLGLVFWNRGVAEIGANRASPFMHLMPVFTSLLAVAFLGERFGWHHGAGIAAILGGVWLASRR
jgi:drug/metabolite transporter (DMT)-like permease